MAEHIVGDMSDTDDFFSNLFDPEQCSSRQEHKGHTWTPVDSTDQRWCHGFYPAWNPDDVDKFLEG